jgi:hypothetical protein
MLLKNRLSNGRPVPRAAIKHLVKSMRKDVRGYCSRRDGSEPAALPNIYQDLDARRFLNKQRAAACCLSADLILLRRNPSWSTLLEEAGHALQFHLGVYNDVVERTGNLLADVIMEYMIAKILIRNAVRWRLPSRELSEIRIRARRFQTAAKKKGGLSWDIRLKLRRSEKCIARMLESWMGRFWKVA